MPFGMGFVGPSQQAHCAWQTAAESSRRSVAARRSGITAVASPQFPKNLRMGTVLSVGWLRVESEKRLGQSVPHLAVPGVTQGWYFGNVGSAATLSQGAERAANSGSWFAFFRAETITCAQGHFQFH